MTPEDIKLLNQIFSPKPKTDSIPFPMGDPRAEEERRRLEAEFQARMNKQRQTYSQAPLVDRLGATGKGAGFLAGSMVEALAEPFANLGGKTTEGALTQYLTPKTPVEGAALSQMAELLEPVGQAFDYLKIPDLTPGMLTSPTRLIDDATRQAAMGLQRGAKAAARSTEDILRSEFAKAPVGSIKLPETQREPDVNPLGFYSELSRATNSLRQEKGTGQQFLSQLRSMPGVKADELKWTGLDDFLSKKDKVTKGEISDYLNANQVQVDEVRLETLEALEARNQQIAEKYGYQAEFYNGEIGFFDPRLDDYVEFRDLPVEMRTEISNSQTQFGGITKFQDYSVSGGENYRELLLKLPEQKSPYDKFLDDMYKKYGKGTPRSQWTDEDNAIYKKFVFSKLEDQNFRSTHFDQPNILAHLRVSDFEQDGKKIMLIDEIQSDWHQTGRKKGYQRDKQEVAAETQKFVDEMKSDYEFDLMDRGATPQQARDAVRRLDNPDGHAQMAQALGRMQQFVETRSAASPYLVPDAPFKTTWHEMALRRAIQEASEKGFDKVAIPVGSVQAERYDLSKQVDSIVYAKENDGTYFLVAIKDGRELVKRDSVVESALPDLVGKEVAERMAASEGKTIPGGPERELSGENLRVGGEGMKGFYDQIVPKYLNKLGSKFGTKVTRGTIKDAKGNDVPVHEMTITPQMRESVLKKGQPLFAAVPAVGLTQEEEGYAKGGSISKAAKAAKKAAKATDIEAEYSQLKAALEQVREGGRTPVVPAPNRWFMNPEKFPGPQNMIERALANVNQERSAFGSGAYINPITGEILDSAVMENLLVAIDPKTGRPMMSGRMTDLEELEKSLGSQTLSNLVRKGLFKHSGGDPILADLPFIATIEKGPHFYGLSTEYVSPAMLFNTGRGDNPTLRPKSRGSVFAVGDEVGEVQLQGRPHPVYEKLLVAPVGSDVQGKLLKKAAGGSIKKAAKAAKKAQKPQVNLEEGFDKFQREANLAKFLDPSQVKDRLYHGTKADIKDFVPGKTGAVFLTPDTNFANDYAASNVVPVYAQVKNPFDYENQDHIKKIVENGENIEFLLSDIKKGHWSAVEHPRVQSAIKKSGFDSFFVQELNTKNLGVFDPSKIKSAIGNRGTYDITDPDITKAAGGAIKRAAKAAKKTNPSAFGGAYDDSVLRRAKEEFATTYGMDFGEGLSKDYDFVNINKIKPNEKIEESRVKKLMDAIQNENPFNTKIPPIIVDSNGNVLDGHHRLEAARRLGIQSVPVIEKFSVQSGLKIIENDGQGKAAGGSIKKAAKAASKTSEVKEQPIYWGMYRGYAGDDVSSTEPQFAAMDKNVAEYYARKRAAQTGLPPHLEMIYKQLDAGRKYGHTVPIDQHNRELLITQAYELQPEDIKGRYQLKKRGGQVKGNI